MGKAIDPKKARRMVSVRDGICQYCWGGIKSGQEIFYQAEGRLAVHVLCCEGIFQGLNLKGQTLVVAEVQQDLKDGEWVIRKTVERFRGQSFQDAMTIYGEWFSRRVVQGFDLRYDVAYCASGRTVCSGTDGRGHRSVLEIRVDQGGTEGVPGMDPDPVFDWAEGVDRYMSDPFDHAHGGCHERCSCRTGVPQGTGPATAAEARDRAQKAVEKGQERQARKRGLRMPGAKAVISNYDPVNDGVGRETLDDRVARKQEEVKQGSGISDGTYTVEYADGSYRTVRLKTGRIGQMFGYLSGRDNERDFTYVAFIKSGGVLHFWTKCTLTEPKKVELRQAAKVLADDPAAAGEAWALSSNRCYRCGRKLTVPASIHRGLGPECAGKIGL